MAFSTRKMLITISYYWKQDWVQFCGESDIFFPFFLLINRRKIFVCIFSAITVAQKDEMVKKWNWLVIAECFSKETGSLNNLCSEKTPPMLAVRLDFELGWSRWNLDKLTRAMLVLIIDKNDSSCYNHQIIICLPNYLKPNFYQYPKANQT